MKKENSNRHCFKNNSIYNSGFSSAFILLGFLITGLGFLLPICGGIFPHKGRGLRSKKKVEHIQVRAIIDFYSDSGYAL